MSRTFPTAPGLPDLVEREGVTEKEAREMLRWAFEQVHVAAAIYAVVTAPKSPTTRSRISPL